MANWCNLRLSVIGTPEEVARFRKAAGPADGRIRADQSRIFTADMERGEGDDLKAYGTKRWGRRFERAEYVLQGRNTDYSDEFLEISTRHPQLAFVLTFSDPNDDSHGSYLMLGGDSRMWGIPARLHREVMRKHYKRQGCMDRRGRVDYDHDNADDAEWDAFFEMMDLAAAHWDGKILQWLRARRG
jgi:hypothetical protein